MHSNVTRDAYINGTNDNLSVANSFATQFESISNSAVNDCDKREFESLLNQMSYDSSSTDILSSINVEFVDSCIRELKTGKASGADELNAEHLLNAHPLVVVYLSLLFRSILKHNYIRPHRFWARYCCSFIKGQIGQCE